MNREFQEANSIRAQIWVIDVKSVCHLPRADQLGIAIGLL
jgi:hypothetical protein